MGTAHTSEAFNAKSDITVSSVRWTNVTPKLLVTWIAWVVDKTKVSLVILNKESLGGLNFRNSRALLGSLTRGVILDYIAAAPVSCWAMTKRDMPRGRRQPCHAGCGRRDFAPVGIVRTAADRAESYGGYGNLLVSSNIAGWSKVVPAERTEQSLTFLVDRHHDRRDNGLFAGLLADYLVWLAGEVLCKGGNCGAVAFAARNLPCA